MRRTPKHEQVESRFRALLDDAELPHPDRVECAPTSVVFFWDEPSVAVAVDFERDAQDTLDSLEFEDYQDLAAPPGHAPPCG